MSVRYKERAGYKRKRFLCGNLFFCAFLMKPKRDFGYSDEKVGFSKKELTNRSVEYKIIYIIKLIYKVIKKVM